MANTQDTKSSVDKAFDILEFLKHSRRPVSLKEIAAALNMPKSSVHGLITKLVHQNVATQDPHTGMYNLGIRLLELGNSFVLSQDIIAYSRQVMQAISDKCMVSVHLMAAKYPEVVLIASAEPSNVRMKLVMSIGTVCPMYNNAAGRVFLAELSDAQLRRYAEGMTYKAYTQYSCRSPENLISRIEACRRKGYGEDHNERNIGMHGIAFPVYNIHGEIEYTLSTCGIINRSEKSIVNTMIRETKAGASILSRYLGYTE